MIRTIVGGLLIAASAGLLTGMFGVGGGFLITPLLNILLGVPIPLAVGSDVMNILGVSTAGIYWRRKSNLADYKLAIVLFGGNATGVYFGTRTLEYFKTLGELTLNGSSIAVADFIGLVIFVILLSAIFVWMFKETRSDRGPTVRIGLFARFKIPPYATFRGLEEPRLSIPVISYFFLFMGYLTGLLGVGGGIVLLPALVYLIGMRTHRAIVTSLVLIWLSTLVASITHIAAGNVDLSLLMALLVGGTSGFRIGSRLAGKMEGLKLRRIFSYLVLGVALMILVRLVFAFI